jgi:hypothetical protein
MCGRDGTLYCTKFYTENLKKKEHIRDVMIDGRILK